MNVGARLSRDTTGLTTLQQSETVCCICHRVLALSFDENSRVLILANIQWLLAVAILEQVKQFLVIDL